jgi:hypothetical protein
MCSKLESVTFGEEPQVGTNRIDVDKSLFSTFIRKTIQPDRLISAWPP